VAYRHITSCIPLGQQQSKVQRMVAHGVPAGIVGAVLGAIVGGGLGALAGFGATIGLSAVLGFCDWWFHYRLICIRDDQCAVGTVGRTAVSTGIDDPDLDFTINLVLAPVDKDSHLDGAAQIPLLQPSGQDRYYTPQPGYPPLSGMNELSTEEEGSSNPKTTALHCEIEGNGMETVCTAATVAGVVGAVAGTAAGIAAGAAAAAGCLAFLIFAPLCWLAAALAALAAAAATSAVVTGAGWVLGVALGGDKGSPADVAAEPGSGTIAVGDHVAIVGDWIFDNAHDGWHELHPVKKLLKLPCPEWKVPGVDVEEPHSERSRAAIEDNCLRLLGDNARRICELLAQGALPDVQGRQQDPHNDPAVHPNLG
jgi:hypothetical protein